MAISMLRVRLVQVFLAPVRAAWLACCGQCRESNHDGGGASIDMRNYRRVTDMPDPSQRVLSDPTGS